MHEASLMKDLLQKIDTVVQEQSGTRATAIQVRLGALCHLSADHFREHFEHASQGTIAQGAQLLITTSDDIRDPLAQEILLETVEIEP